MADPISVTYVSSSSFSVEGDKTDEYVEGRAIKLFQPIGNETVVAVVSSSYSTETTVVVTPASVDSGITGIKRGPIGRVNFGKIPISDLVLPSGGNDGDALIKDGETVVWGKGGGGGVAGAQTWIMHMMGL